MLKRYKFTIRWLSNNDDTAYEDMLDYISKNPSEVRESFNMAEDGMYALEPLRCPLKGVCCLQKMCAWWNHLDEECSVVTLGTLATIDIGGHGPP